MKNWSLSTTTGCRRLLALCLALMLIFSFAAHWMSTEGGAVKNVRVSFDARGATLDGELYYPAGTTDEDKLPGVVVTCGAGCTFGVTSGIAQELARRGFVVLNMSAYGTGLSEFPERDEIGAGEENYDARATPGGLWDCLNFLRTLTFVDQTRLGLTGHSQGSRRTSYAAAIDAGYLTFNDQMINVLYDTFGQTFTAEEIVMNADELAAARLNPDQLAHYETIRADKKEYYDTRVKAELLIGGDGTLISPLKTVTVAGHEVQRNCQTNVGFVIGDYDTSYIDYPSRATTMESYYTDTALTPEDWYVIDDLGQKSTSLGNIFETDVTKNEELKAAIENRQTRIISFNPETHSRNFLSIDTAEDVVKYFEQVLAYNGGELGAADAKPLDASKIMYVWREVVNSLAMWAMFFMLLPLAGLLLKTPFFAGCVMKNKKEASGIDNKQYIIFAVVAALLGFFAIYKTNSLFAPALPYYEFIPMTFNWWMTAIYLGIMAVGSIVLVVLFRVLDKKAGKVPACVGLKLGVVNVLKTVLLSFILIAVAYLMMAVCVYLFNEDFRFWVTIFTEMKVEYWNFMLRFAILFLPCLLCVGALTNYTVRKDLPEWLDTLIVVAISSVGVYLCWGINYLVLHAGGAAICNWNSSYAMLVMVPVTAYLSRKTYKLTGSIWLGALVNALLIGWTTVSSMGYNTYFAQDFISIFFNV